MGDQDPEPLRRPTSCSPPPCGPGSPPASLVRPGGHDFDLWSQALQDSFPWLAWRLGLTPEPAQEPATCAVAVSPPSVRRRTILAHMSSTVVSNGWR